MKIKITKQLKNLAKIISKETSLYVVGGYVRDSILKKINNDIDLTSNLKINELENLLENTSFYLENINKQFGTAKIKSKEDNTVSFDYTCFRYDVYNGGKHSPRQIEFVNSIEEDASRRDFTINSIYYNINNKKFYDPFNGIKDIKDKQIREINSQTLKYDGERLLRLIKFASILQFNIEEQTLINALKYKENLNALSDITLQKFIVSVKSLGENETKQIKNYLQLLGFEKLINEIYRG